MAEAEILERCTVEQRQAAREELAIDDAFAEPADDAKADARRQRLERGADAFAVAGFETRQAIAQHDPVYRHAIGLGTGAPGIPDQFGVETRALDSERLRIDLADQVEIDKAVVDRGDDGVRGSERSTRERGIAPRRIDDQEIHALCLGNPLRQHIDIAFTIGDDGNIRGGQRKAALAKIGDTVFEIARYGTLTRIEIEHRGPEPRVRQRDRDMHRRRRFSGPALFIAQNNDVHPTGGNWRC